jgi:hypothetical protein
MNFVTCTLFHFGCHRGGGRNVTDSLGNTPWGADTELYVHRGTVLTCYSLLIPKICNKIGTESINIDRHRSPILIQQDRFSNRL